MKVKFFYKIAKNGELWPLLCEIIDDEKYNVNYSRYLAGAVWEMRYVSSVDRELDEIERVESEEIECFETGTEIFFTSVYKDRVEFESDGFYDWPDWSCTLDEYKRVLLGKKAFLMLPKEIESYLEIKINDIEK